MTGEDGLRHTDLIGAACQNVDENQLSLIAGSELSVLCICMPSIFGRNGLHHLLVHTAFVRRVI